MKPPFSIAPEDEYPLYVIGYYQPLQNEDKDMRVAGVLRLSDFS